MPIESPIPNAFEIRDLAVGTDTNGGQYLTWSLRGDVGGVDAYVLCSVSGAPVRRCDVEGLLAEADLTMLARQGERRVELTDGRSCTLVGVTQAAFQARPRVAVRAEAPARFHVWVLSLNYARATLYIPDEPGNECCIIPIRYQWEFRPGETMGLFRRKGRRPSYLRVDMEEAGVYAEGGLQYRVGDLAPIPLPRCWIGRDIPLMIEDPEGIEVCVEPSPGFEAEYRPYGR